MKDSTEPLNFIGALFARKIVGMGKNTCVYGVCMSENQIRVNNFPTILSRINYDKTTIRLPSINKRGPQLRAYNSDLKQSCGLTTKNVDVNAVYYVSSP